MNDAPGTAADGAEDRSGASLGEYRIVRVLGRGGMGTVYEAVQHEAGRAVALKMVHGGPLVDEETRALFRREIRALARLEHPGIASLYTSGTTPDGVPFFAMELAEGRPLDEWRKARPATSDAEIRRRVSVLIQVCEAVAYAHAHGVIHRDLKPSNVFVRELGDGVTVKVLDFGLARIVEQDGGARSRVTEHGTLRGTVPYMSPEQLAGDPELVDVRSDVYALGVLLYELLSGKHPHDADGATPFDLPGKILREPATPIARAWTGHRRLDPDLATVVMKCLEKEPGRRYPTAQGLANDLRRWQAGLPIAARPPSTAYQLRKMIGRNRTGFALIVAAAAVLVGASVWLAVLSTHLARERDRANREADAARANAAAFSRVLLQLAPGIGPRRVDDPEAVAAMIEQIERSSESGPQEKITLLMAGGTAMFENGAYDAGIRFVEQAAAIDRATDRERHASGVLAALGEMYLRVGRAQEAEPLFRDIVEVYASMAVPPPAKDRGYALENLGCAVRDLGRFDEAQSLLDEALALYRSAPVPNPYYVASAHDSLGNLALARGDLAAAEQHHRQALELREEGTNPQTTNMKQAQSLHDLGTTLLRRGKLDEAERDLERALAARELALGPMHPDTAATLAELGELALARGRAAEARAYLDRAASIYRERLRPDHPARVALERRLAELGAGA